jgi:hypothetical protein
VASRRHPGSTTTDALPSRIWQRVRHPPNRSLSGSW